ncbi:F0F1 ATP synthase subunit delta [Candidatus Kaiserbacteria bacterium]|nr:F0F1 ATP synthase subunit delta [Candidatus Kaiserbacteria bacterium]
MERSYAQALWKMVEGGVTPAKAVHALRDTLKAHGRDALLPRIASAFSRIAEREAKRTDVVLTVAREKDERHAHRDIRGLLREMGVEAKDLKTQVDDTLVGGWRLEGREHLVDASYKKQLLDLYTRVTS